jgi:hypothetical protein
MLTPDANGQYPERTLSTVYDSLDNYTVDLGTKEVNHVVSTPDDRSGHGGGAATQFGVTASDPGPGQVGSLGDSGGNWSNTDDQYRIYYGNQTRYEYHAPTTWDGASVGTQVPDGDGGTKTDAPSVPAAK